MNTDISVIWVTDFFFPLRSNAVWLCLPFHAPNGDDLTEGQEVSLMA